MRERNTLCEKKEYPPWEKRISSMREGTPQRITCVSSHSEGSFYFSQKNTDEQNTQSPTETLSQPISQNLTATFSWNVLWYLYAEGVLWTRNVGGKVLLHLCVLWEKEIPSVREKDFLRERERYSLWEKEISSVRKKHYPPCEKELPKESWCKRNKKIKGILKNQPAPPSIQEHALLDARTCPSRHKNTPFLMLDKALLLPCS